MNSKRILPCWSYCLYISSTIGSRQHLFLKIGTSVDYNTLNWEAMGRNFQINIFICSAQLRNDMQSNISYYYHARQILKIAKPYALYGTPRSLKSVYGPRFVVFWQISAMDLQRFDIVNTIETKNITGYRFCGINCRFSLMNRWWDIQILYIYISLPTKTFWHDMTCSMMDVMYQKNFDIHSQQMCLVSQQLFFKEGDYQS